MKLYSMKNILLPILLSGVCSLSNAVATDESRTNLIASIGASGNLSYLMLQSAPIDTSCLNGVIYFPAYASVETKYLFAAALSAYSQIIPLNRIIYDRDTGTNQCTLFLLNF